MEALYARIGEVDPISGKRITLALVVSQLARVILGDETPSLGSFKRHFQGQSPHSRVVTARDAARQDREERAAASDSIDADTEALLAEIEAELEGTPSGVGVARLQLRAFLLDFKRRVAAGQPPRMTPDQAIRAGQLLLSSERASGEADLLRVLTGAIAASAQRSLGHGGAPALEQGDVIEVEGRDLGDE